ncbi:tungstate transport system ATP-binding protein [Carboxydocella sporoproducens DSM 16521]|uniref:Tungstate transport system ATP-binding protein n=2 Tax=Carboxydocella TaxID=178898 RepID=A0A1T4NKE0_9FIRM|nr:MULTISPECIES: ABC transporter ATP-binding protein [Carboxydocella]AVX20084.1 tungstate transport system ATP-binding protein [Carboxydocella thermautotrophica]AVX30501.1 tungstate transport system ATP-binding protein [Carboxydocella thermautotrophica]GAW27840.1 hypothetical protein ULO1_04100 [Carboxydocella sp. ULO1]SJZ79750.1 tungstate transport system ATP-binding protein [Carboxydocella sporoproducens DSM 16521]
MGWPLLLENLQVKRGGKLVLAVPRLELGAGEIMAVLGPNGAGKSTLLLTVAGILCPSQGSIRAGEMVWGPGRDPYQWRQAVTLVFQEALLVSGTVLDNVTLGLKFRGLSAREREQLAGPWLERLGLTELARRRVQDLSGGEAQRVALARALVLKPQVLLLDEPFAAVDAPTRSRLLRELRLLLKETGITTLFITHDFRELPLLADRGLVLLQGQMAQVGTVRELAERPASEAIARFFGVENLWPTGGSLPGLKELPPGLGAIPARCVRILGAKPAVAGESWLWPGKVKYVEEHWDGVYYCLLCEGLEVWGWADNQLRLQLGEQAWAVINKKQLHYIETRNSLNFLSDQEGLPG